MVMTLHNTWCDVHHAHIMENCPYNFHSTWLGKYVSSLIKQNKLTISWMISTWWTPSLLFLEECGKWELSFGSSRMTFCACIKGMFTQFLMCKKVVYGMMKKG